jgi:hypothetical protein
MTVLSGREGMCGGQEAVVVGWLLTLMTSVVVDFVVVVVGFTASTVVVKEESVPAIHNGRGL